MTKYIMLTGCDGWDPDGPGEGKGTRICLSVDNITMFRDITEVDLKKWPDLSEVGKGKYADWKPPYSIVEHNKTIYEVRNTVGEIQEKIREKQSRSLPREYEFVPVPPSKKYEPGPPPTGDPNHEV